MIRPRRWILAGVAAFPPLAILSRTQAALGRNDAAARTGRHVVLSVEATGLSSELGHRVCEIAAVETRFRIQTGRVFHAVLNPGSAFDPTVAEITGLHDTDLSGQPTFSAIAPELLAFLGDAPLVIHNASYALRFLDAEFQQLGLTPIPPQRAICTVALSRAHWPGHPAVLPAVMERLGIAVLHNAPLDALADARITAEIYSRFHIALAPGGGFGHA